MAINWPLMISVPGGVASLVIVWGTFGFPTWATSSDIQRLDRKQAIDAVEIYDNKLRRYLAQQPPTDPVSRQIWEEEIRRSRQQVDEAEKRRIETSK